MAFPSFNGNEGSDMVELQIFCQLIAFCRSGMMSDAKTMKDVKLTENTSFRKVKKVGGP
jgi:hypothetical protein